MINDSSITDLVLRDTTNSHHNTPIPIGALCHTGSIKLKTSPYGLRCDIITTSGCLPFIALIYL